MVVAQQWRCRIEYLDTTSITQDQKHAMTYRDVAQHFGDLITRKEYSAAWELLSKEAQASIPPAAIQTAVATMIASAPGPIREAQVMEEFILEDWPGKQRGDLAVVYVALSGESFSEAVTLTLAQSGNNTLIRHLEWGRP